MKLIFQLHQPRKKHYNRDDLFLKEISKLHLTNCTPSLSKLWLVDNLHINKQLLLYNKLILYCGNKDLTDMSRSITRWLFSYISFRHEFPFAHMYLCMPTPFVTHTKHTKMIFNCIPQNIVQFFNVPSQEKVWPIY